MKIVVTYEQADIVRLIEKDLRAKGVKFDAASAKYKGSAKWVVEVDGQDETESNEALEVPAPALAPKRVEKSGSKPVTVETPSEAAPEDDMDLSTVIEQSNRNAEKPGIYPPRQLMDGESFEWPGSPPPRGR